MARVNELNAASSFLHQKLIANATILSIVGVHPIHNIPQVYEDLAPQEAVFPYIVVKHIGTSVVHGTYKNYKALVKSRFHILAIGIGETYSAVADLANEIEDTLQWQVERENLSLVMGLGTTHLIKRTYIEDGVRYLEMGSSVNVHIAPQE